MGDAHVPAPGLKRSLHLWQVTVSGIGIVIGAGIYVLVGEGAGEAGAAVWLSFGVAALLSGFTAMSYCELTGMYPSAGVEYTWGSRAFNPFVGFAAGWMMAAAFVVAAGAVSLGFAQYLQHFFDIDARVTAIALLAALTVIVISGVERSIWLSVVLAMAQIGGLLIVIAAGVPSFGERSLIEGASITGIMSGAALVFFAFIGFDDIATLSEETEDAANVVPRALILTLAISAGLYMLVGISAVSVVGADALAGADRPLALVIDEEWGSWGSDFISVIALAATVNTTLLVLTAAARLLYAMAREGALPPVLARLGRAQSPWVAALVGFAGAAAFASVGDIGLIAGVTDFAVYCTFLSVNLAVVALRFRAPDVPRAFRIPFSVGAVPVTAVLGTVSVLAMVGFLEPSAWALGLGTLVVGTGVFFTLRRMDIAAGKAV